LTVLLLQAAMAHATVYQYFDEEGTLIVTNVPHRSKRLVPLPEKKVDRGYEQRSREIRLNFKDDVYYDYYPVSGKTFQEAVMSTNMNGPFEQKDNKRYAAQTKWNMGWSYKFSSSYKAGGSSVYVSLNIYDFEFRSDITVLLPALSEGSALNEHDLALWEKFVQGLLAHEHDHVALIQDASFRAEAKRKISSIRDLSLPYDPSMVLDQEIKNAVESQTAKIGHDLIMEIKGRNDEYDRLTEHGLRPEMRQGFFR